MDTTPRVVGLDLSMTATGIAIPDLTTTVTTKTKGDARLVDIRAAVNTAIGQGCDLAVIEDLPTHAKSAGITGMVHGAVRSLLIDRRVHYALVSPATLKAFATGKGNADKTAMAIAALKRTGLEFGDDNQVDAYWLRAAGMQHLGHPIVDVPAAQVARLDKAKWPVLEVAR